MGAHSTDEDTVAPSVNNGVQDVDVEEKAAVVPPKSGSSASSIDEKGEKKKKANPQTEEDVVYPTGVKVFAICGALMLAIFLVALDQTIIA